MAASPSALDPADVLAPRSGLSHVGSGIRSGPAGRAGPMSPLPSQERPRPAPRGRAKPRSDDPRGPGSRFPRRDQGCPWVRRRAAMRSPASPAAGERREPPGRRTAEQGDAIAPLLFDHLVGDGEQLLRDVDAEQFGGRGIDGEIELDRELNRKIARLVAL